MESNIENLADAKIILTNEMLNNFQFQQALTNLKRMPFSVKTAYKVSYISEHVNRHVAQGREIFQDIAKKFAITDENGNLVPETDTDGAIIPGSIKLKDGISEDDFQKEQEEFMAIEHIIPKHKLTVTELGDSQLTANDISALSPLFSDLD